MAVHTQRCVSKIGEPYRMRECGRPVEYLTQQDAVTRNRGAYSGWYHIAPTLDADHWPTPESWVS